MTTFNWSSGDPTRLVGGTTAAMSDISGPFDDLKTFLNGNLTAVNVTDGTLDNDTLDGTTVAAKLGLSQTGTVRRGKSIVATEESRTNTAYGTLTTPDRVSSVVLPTDGLLFVAYQAQWKNSVTGNGRAAIFLGSNQLKIAELATAAPIVQEANGPSAVDTYRPLASSSTGLRSNNTSAYSGDVTTGQILSHALDSGSGLGGAAIVFAAAGTYDVSIQFKSASGSVSVKNRNLWVWTIGF